jgi:Uma2 family endonuclease
MAIDAYSQSQDIEYVLPPELRPNIDHIVTEDNEPMDNVFSEKQQRLLIRSLHASWPGPAPNVPFVAMANVGMFFQLYQPPIVPDVLLSLNVALPCDVRPKSARSYFIWEYGKPPEVVVEIVSNKEGNEDTKKLAKYAELGVRYYAIFDPDQLLSREVLRVYRLNGFPPEQVHEPIWFPGVNLGLQLWYGKFEELQTTWLRWVDSQGALIPTGEERAFEADQRAEAADQRAEAERKRAEEADQRAGAEHRRADLLAAKLRELGIDFDADQT